MDGLFMYTQFPNGISVVLCCYNSATRVPETPHRSARLEPAAKEQDVLFQVLARPAMAGACFGGEPVPHRALGAKSEKVAELLADKKSSLSRSCGECQKHLGGKSSTRSAFTFRRSVTCFGGSDVVRASGCRDKHRRQRGSVCGWKNGVCCRCAGSETP